MALCKEIKSDNGITGTYHRIGSIIKNHNKLSVVVESYTDSTYRQQEKEQIILAAQTDNLILRLSELTGSPETEEGKKEIEEINTKIERYQELCKTGQFYAFKTTVLLDWDAEETISFETAYQKLTEKSTIFDGAKLAE